MRLDLDGRATSALDERSHGLDVLTDAMRRGLPMHLHENVIGVVASEDALSVRSVPAREIELVHVFEIVRYRVVGHDRCLLLGPSRSGLRLTLLSQ